MTEISRSSPPAWLTASAVRGLPSTAALIAAADADFTFAHEPCIIKDIVVTSCNKVKP